MQIGCGELVLGAGNIYLFSICAEPNTTDSSSMTRALKHCTNINPKVGIVDILVCIMNKGMCPLAIKPVPDNHQAMYVYNYAYTTGSKLNSCFKNILQGHIFEVLQFHMSKGT